MAEKLKDCNSSVFCKGTDLVFNLGTLSNHPLEETQQTNSICQCKSHKTTAEHYTNTVQTARIQFTGSKIIFPVSHVRVQHSANGIQSCHPLLAVKRLQKATTATKIAQMRSRRMASQRLVARNRNHTLVCTSWWLLNWLMKVCCMQYARIVCRPCSEALTCENSGLRAITHASQIINLALV